MSSESEVRSRYLALALDARKIIDALILFVDQEIRQKGFDDSLKGAIESLRATEREEIFSPARNRLSFSEYYEQVRTVREALSKEEMGIIVRKLTTVRLNEADVRQQKNDAYEAIKLLSVIESRALCYYRPQP